MSLTVRHAGGNYESVGFSRYEWLGPEWRRFSVPFVASQESGSFQSRVDIYGIVGKPILVDRVSLTRLNGIAYNPTTADVLDLVNASASPQSFDCPATRVTSCSNYVRTDGSAVSWPVVVPAWTVTALVWKGSPFSTSP